jgi:hypothetical protein
MILAKPRALKRGQSLRRDPQRIADRQADAPLAQVQRQNPALQRTLRHLLGMRASAKCR